MFDSSRSRLWQDTQGAFEPRQACAETADRASHPLAKVGHIATKVGHFTQSNLTRGRRVRAQQ